MFSETELRLLTELAKAQTDLEIALVLMKLEINQNYAAVLKHRIKTKARLMQQQLEIYAQVAQKLEKLPGVLRALEAEVQPPIPVGE